MSCPDDNQLSAMLQGFLDDDEVHTIEAHLDGCPQCMQLVVDLLAGDASDTVLPQIGRYEVLERVGVGGQGLVFAAFDPELQRRVAIKLVRPDRDPEPARLQREARMLASLSNAHVMPVFEVGPWGDGVYLVTELGQGSLRAWVDDRRPWREVLDVWLGVCAGLSAAHRAGLVHRDLKPDNVVLHADGRALLTDFGLASASASSEVSAGTPLYLAPELQAGQPADARSDQFALCVGLYETLTGRPPFEGRTVVELASRARAGPPPRPAGVPARIHAVVARGLTADPAARFPDIDALARALRAAAAPRSVGGLAVAAIALAALGLVGLGSFLGGTPAPAGAPASLATTIPVAQLPVPPPAAADGPIAFLVAQCAVEAEKLHLAPCEDVACANAQRGRVLGLTECYSRAKDCDAFHRWFDRLAEIDPEAPVDVWRASNSICLPRADDIAGRLRHFINFGSVGLSEDVQACLDGGERAREWMAHPEATESDVEALWRVQLAAIQTLHTWHSDTAAARAEAERATAAFERPMPAGMLP